MKALTVQQPWAWAIVHGGKDVENRTQAWGYRGPLAIHAGMRWSTRGAESPLVVEAAFDSLIRRGLLHPDRREAMVEAAHRIGGMRWTEQTPMGAVIGVVDLVDVHLAMGDEHGPCCDSPWAETSYAEHRAGLPDRTPRDVVHLVLEHPRPLAEPVPCRGALGLWTVPPEVEDQILRSDLRAILAQAGDPQ